MEEYDTMTHFSFGLMSDNTFRKLWWEETHHFHQEDPLNNAQQCAWTIVRSNGPFFNFENYLPMKADHTVLVINH